MRASRDGAGGWSLGYQGPRGVRGALLPSTLTRKMRLSWGVSHRYSPASPLRAPPHPQHLPRPGLLQLHPPLARQSLPILVPACGAPRP